MDNNPFEIPPLVSSSMGNSRATSAGDKENSVRSTIHQNIDRPISKMSSSSSALQHPTKYSRLHNRLPHDGKASASSSSKSPGWNGTFSSSLSSSPSMPASSSQATSAKRKLGSGSKLLSTTSNRTNLPLRALGQPVASRNQHHHSSPLSRSLLSPPLLNSSPADPVLPQSSSNTTHPIPSSASKIKDSDVLRQGETMNGFFCIQHDSPEEYIQLVESLVDRSHANNPTTWRKVLDMAMKASIAPLYLVRMHRRATMRFRLEPQELAALSSERQRQDILKMWVSNAEAYALSGNIIEARNTYQHIDNKSKALQDMVDTGGSQVVASFYLAFAVFECEHGQDKKRARDILNRGIDATKDLDGKLQQYATSFLSISGGKSSKKRSTPKTAEKSWMDARRTPLSVSREPEVARSTQKFRSSLLDPTLQGGIRSTPKGSLVDATKLSPRKDRARSTTPTRSPKRLKASPKRENVKFDQTAGTDRTQCSPIPAMKKIVSIRSPKSIATQATETRTIAAAPAAVVTATETVLASGKPPAHSAKKRSSLTSRLGRTGLSGAPKRVEPEQSMALDGEDLSSDDSDQESACDEDTKVPSFKSLDLSYIWDWKPKGVENNDQTGGAMGTIQATHASGESSDDSGAASKLKENDELDKKEQKNQKKPIKQEEKEKTRDMGDAVKETASSTNGNDSAQQIAAVDDREARKQRLMEKANLDFLPLVHEDNILRVNKHSYVKLGAIGKGGSCKVYRALSKKCSVVAIKKVKLDGMDRKQIEGYANEISLLKRLRGNPSIIQMYDSELDVRRKSLFVVMEVGEVDLNYVLHQRAQAKTSKSLDMNFIRLTWQQMLSAVHSIHQEKIIHSDLKPANFLFVRGALKLIDFGIAKAIANPEDTTKIIRESQIGTLNYMSPESIMDTGEGGGAGPRMKIGRASDVWSLGIILYEMLYGKTPFAHLHFIVKLQAIINEDHQIPFPNAGGSADPAIDAIKQCLRRRPDERPPIVGESGLLNEHWFLHSKRDTAK